MTAGATTAGSAATTAAHPRAILQGREVAPSILSANFAALGEQVKTVLDAGAKVIHVDVMDGHFVPPITFGPLAVSAIVEQVHQRDAILDVHLMIERPERQVEAFAEAGADSITIHAEATPHVHYALQLIREKGCASGLAICPATPVAAVSEAAADGVLDLVLCMSVNPGWGNQRLIGHSFAKLAQLRSELPANVALQVDGGVNAQTARACADAGANLLVAGSAVFGSSDPGKAFSEIANAAWQNS